MPWLLAAICLLAYEGYALRTGHKTLSRMMWEATAKFPALPFLIGFGIGFLAAHFWWGGALVCYGKP